MQFKVPQFIDVEDKLFGPFTFKEFAYMAGGGGMIFVLYRLLPFWVAIIPMILVAGFTAALTFYKINGKPFIYYVQASLNYAIKSKLYIWKQRLTKPEDVNKKVETEIPVTVQQVSAGKLKDLAWSLDVLDQNNR